MFSMTRRLVLTKMTQHNLIKEYILEHGSILPAKLTGHIYKETMFGSEISKRCRELRKKGILTSVKDGKFERFYLIPQWQPTDEEHRQNSLL